MVFNLLIGPAFIFEPCSYFSVVQEGLFSGAYINTLWTGDADLRLYITTVQDG